MQNSVRASSGVHHRRSIGARHGHSIHHPIDVRPLVTTLLIASCIPGCAPQGPPADACAWSLVDAGVWPPCTCNEGHWYVCPTTTVDSCWTAGIVAAHPIPPCTDARCNTGLACTLVGECCLGPGRTGRCVDGMFVVFTSDAGVDAACGDSGP
jgi:hypothetical protein